MKRVIEEPAKVPLGGRLFWRLLTPFLLLLLSTGIVGAVLIVRDLTGRAESALDQELIRRSLEARSILHDRELYLLESVNFASNLEGMAEGVGTRAGRDVETLLRSVLFLKTDVELAAATDARGRSLSELDRNRSGAAVEAAGRDWSSWDFVGRALQDEEGRKWSGIIAREGTQMLAIAAPICSAVRPCAPVGAAVVGVGIGTLADEILARAAGAGAAGPASVAIFDDQASLIATSGPIAAPPSIASAGNVTRRVHGSGDEEAASLLSPLEVQGRTLGTLAVSIRTRPEFAAARAAALRLALVLAVAMIGVIGIGALVTRFILRQVRPLLTTNRALGAGDFSARAPVISRDELGELAKGVNQMADQLQASYETLEMRVEQRTEEVRRLLQERSELFAGLSHELRTPVAVILTQAAILNDPSYIRTRARVGEVADVIAQSGEQLLGLINEILEFAKAEAGRLDVRVADIRLGEILRPMRGTMEGLARSGGLELSVKIPRDLPPVRADAARLREVLLNLVDNAVKYSAPGGKIEVSAAARNGSVDLSVADTGVGIPNDVGESIFEPFYRVPGSETQAGQPASGLGLALSKRLIEAQGGVIRYESVPGSGSTFVVALERASVASRRNARRRKA